MRLFISLFFFFTIYSLCSQTEFVKVFTDQTVLSRISTNGSLIAAVGQKNGRQIALKTLNYQGELLGESNDFLQYMSAYDDVLVLNDSSVITSGHFITSLASGGPFSGSEVRMYNSAAERTVFGFLRMNLQIASGISNLAPVSNNRFLFSAGGALGYAQLGDDNHLTAIEDTTFDPSGSSSDYHFLENWQDSLAVIISNNLDSMFLHKFTGERVHDIQLDEDITATCLVGNTLWLTDDTYLYQYTMPEMEVEQVFPLPEAPLTFGLEWVGDEGKLLFFERSNLGSSDCWMFDPISMQWEELGQISLPNAKLLDMIYYQGSYLFCGSYINVFGESTSFIGKSGDPVFEFPEPETDIGIKAQLELVDTSFFETDFFYRSDLTWEVKITLTNHGIAPVDEIIWKSDSYLRSYYPPNSNYHQLHDTLQEQLLPTDSITFTTQFIINVASSSPEGLEEKLAEPYTICFYANAINDFGDYARENNVSCPTGEIEPEMEPEMEPDPEPDSEESDLIKMYPNPAVDKLFLEAKSSEFIEEWKILSVLGNVVDTEILDTPVQEVSIDLPLLPSGLYWMGIYLTETKVWYPFFIK